MSLKAGEEEFAIYCSNDHGPIFGRGDHDLSIADTPNSCKCNVRLDNSYECPPGEDFKTFLTGEGEFYVGDMEVFGFEK